MKRSVIAGLCVVAVLFFGGMAQANIQSYSLVDYPSYQTDFDTGLTDQISGIITADPATGEIFSASFTISNGANSYTVDSAAITAPYYVHVSPTQITLTQINPSNPQGYGSLHLSGLTTVGGYSALLDWYTPGNPWVPGSNNYAGYAGSVSIHKAYGAEFGTDLGTNYSGVVATVVGGVGPVPEPITMTLVGMGILGLGGYVRRRTKAAK